jgi:SHAQKYF class myb-like DNA-binding protein
MSDAGFIGKRKRPADETESDDFPIGSSVDSDKWTEELHRFFAAAIYDAGVAQASPSVIMENMTERPASLTSERVKSHLQKYRKNRTKSKQDFLHDYDEFMRKAMTVGGAAANASHVIMPLCTLMEMMGGGKPSGGDVAAMLSYAVMTEGEVKNGSGATISSIGIAKDSQDYLKIFAGTHVPFPQLTEEEKRSPLGVSMVYVMGLFSSLSQHMLQERRKSTRPMSIPPTSMQAAADPPVNTVVVDISQGGNSNTASQWEKQRLNDGTTWLGTAVPASPPAFLPLRVHQREPVPSAVNRIRHNAPFDHPGPPSGPPSGLFYPIHSKTDTGPSAHWNAAMQQHQLQAPAVQAFAAQGIPNASQNQTAPSRPDRPGQGPGSYAPV